MPELGISIEDPLVLPETAWSAVNDHVAAIGVLSPEVSGRIRDIAAIGN
jgi:hypothetical protein